MSHRQRARRRFLRRWSPVVGRREAVAAWNGETVERQWQGLDGQPLLGPAASTYRELLQRPYPHTTGTVDVAPVDTDPRDRGAWRRLGILAGRRSGKSSRA